MLGVTHRVHDLVGEWPTLFRLGGPCFRLRCYCLEKLLDVLFLYTKIPCDRLAEGAWEVGRAKHEGLAVEDSGGG